MKPEVRFRTPKDGTTLAYTVSGAGPPIVRAPHWFSHLEHDWSNPAVRPWAEDLSKRYMLLRFDQRGTGLSDREVPEISLEAHVQDLEAAVDAARFERFALLGLSQGAAFAIAYAARHPERVSHLVICGGFAPGRARRSLPPQAPAQMGTPVQLIEPGRGSSDPSVRPVFATQF